MGRRPSRPPPPLLAHMRPRLLTPEQEAAVRAAWASGATRDEAARAAGITVDLLLIRLKDQLADLPRRGRGGLHRRPTPDPTEEEIWGRLTAEIQDKWTDEERAAAWNGSRREPVE
jgi:hypothetical protein